jgi:hypothetical protein
MTTHIENQELRHFEQHAKELEASPKTGQVSRRAARHYLLRAYLFFRLNIEIDKSLRGVHEINQRFAWEMLKCISGDLCKLDACLFGKLPEELASDLECAFMVLNKSRRGRPASQQQYFLSLADRQKMGESWNELTVHAPTCDQKGGCDCRDTTRREPRRLIKYVESLDLKWEDFYDLAFIEENLFVS